MNSILFPKDIIYGDREVMTFDYIGIGVNSERFTSEWLALRLMSDEYRLGIMLYVKSGGTPEQEELNLRIRDAYANAIYNLLMGNIHLDVALDETPLKVNAISGTNYVYINANDAANWPIDPCYRYSVQDNFGTNQDLGIIECGASSSSSLSSLSSLTSESSLSSISPSSQSSLSSGSSATEFSSSLSSPSSSGDDPYTKICLSANLNRNYLLKDKAVLQRVKRYIYNSQVADIEYGVTNKGSAILKAAKISWWGKESRPFEFPQVGRGGNI